MQRKCPKCNEILIYKNKCSFYNARSKNSTCRSCAAKIRGENKKGKTLYDIWLVKFGKEQADKKYKEYHKKRSKSTSGKNNPFYGKTHKQEIKEKLRQINIGKKIPDHVKDKISKSLSGSKNHMYGKSFYDIWLEKYGKEEADKKLDQKKAKHKQLASGKNNPMYGKPSPQGSGNGWKGWYKNIYFRSLREAIFMIRCDEYCIKYQSAEYIKIEYEDAQKKHRTYRPDFICNNTIIEIKPLRLHNSPNNTLKLNALKKYCKNNNLKCKIIDVPIHRLYIENALKNQTLKFDRDYLGKFNNYE